MFFLIMFKNKNLIDINIPYINMPVNHSAKIQSKWKVNFEAFLVYNTWRCLPTLRDGSITQTHTRPLRIFPSPLGRKHTTPRWLQKTKQHSKSSRHGFGCWSWFWFVPLKGRKEELETCSEQIDRKLQFGWQRRRIVAQPKWPESHELLTQENQLSVVVHAGGFWHCLLCSIHPLLVNKTAAAQHSYWIKIKTERKTNACWNRTALSSLLNTEFIVLG